MPKPIASRSISQTLLRVTRLAGSGRFAKAGHVLKRALAGPAASSPLGSSDPVSANEAAFLPAAVTNASAVASALTSPAPDQRPNSARATDTLLKASPPNHTANPGSEVQDMLRLEANDPPLLLCPPVGSNLPQAVQKAVASDLKDAEKPLEKADDKPAGKHDEKDVASAVAKALTKPRPASFSERSIEFEGETYPYRLYVPARPGKPTPAARAALLAAGIAPPQATTLPLLVLLHGCDQDALDFSNGTGMNDLAEQHQCMVLYPEQTSAGNRNRCWNWYEPGHQKRGTGEPGMIAALTQKVLRTTHSGEKADPDRVYIAGLSAGGAMAAVVADLYSDIFAAVGVHSGLPAGAAQGMLSAFSAMQRGATGHPSSAIPTIVFHGTADRTVHPDNGDHVSQAALAALKGSGMALVKRRRKAARVKGREQHTKTEKTIYSSANGPSYIEYWQVEEGPHAWSGGNAEGSYTDPDGPSASAAMMAFFLQHRRHDEVPAKPPAAAKGNND